MINSTSAGTSTPLMLTLQSDANLYQGREPIFDMRSGLTVLVGPNAAGKTSFLRRIRDQLRANNRSGGKHVVYQSAGRGSSLENFRSAVLQPEHAQGEPATIGHKANSARWSQYEGCTGMFMRLYDRSDLLLKVEARLQTLQQRRLRLEWTQGGLLIKFASTKGGTTYFANTEASGLLQLIPLLAAIYDDEIYALIIDEPEISLHPQLQAFLLQEMRRLAGNPSSEREKKFIVLATHSPSMLPIRSIADIAILCPFNCQLMLKNSKVGNWAHLSLV
jgi:predicted ATP-dependent endonuclease of OLD family